MAKQLRAGPLSQDRAALSVLLHEYAHVRQPAPIKRNLIEAGADFWSNLNTDRVARKLKLGPPENMDWANPVGRSRYFGYPELVSNLIRKPGWRSFIDSGQFGKVTPGKPQSLAQIRNERYAAMKLASQMQMKKALKMQGKTRILSRSYGKR